jgi:hypothetical protein
MTNPLRTEPVVSKYTSTQLDRLSRAAARRGLSPGELQKQITYGIIARGCIDDATEKYQSYALDRRGTTIGGKQRQRAEARGDEADLLETAP